MTGGQGAARLGHAVDALGELPHHLGMLRLPKLRQLTTATGVAPTQARLATLSASISAVPARGSSAQRRGLESVVIATPAARAASPGRPGAAARRRRPGPTTVLRKSWWSYWRYTHRGRAQQGEQITRALGRAGASGRRAAASTGAGRGPVVERCVVGQRGRRHVGQIGPSKPSRIRRRPPPSGSGSVTRRSRRPAPPTCRRWPRPRR